MFGLLFLCRVGLIYSLGNVMNGCAQPDNTTPFLFLLKKKKQTQRTPRLLPFLLAPTLVASLERLFGLWSCVVIYYSKFPMKALFLSFRIWIIY